MDTTNSLATTTMVGIVNTTLEQHIINQTELKHHFLDETGSSLVLLQSLQMVLNIVNVIFHSMGVSFLRAIYDRTDFKVQYVYLISLSSCELVINILLTTQCALELVGHSSWWISHNETAYTIDKAISIIYLIWTTGFSLVFFFTMIYITLDRLVDIYLNIHYDVYWNEHRATILIKITWFIGVLVSISSIAFKDWQWEDTFFEIFYPVLEIGFILLAFYTYTFIFRKFKAGRKPPHQPLIKGSKISATRQNSTFEAFRSSRFYISVFLIFTFILFMIIPDLVYLFLVVVPENVLRLSKEKILTGCLISYGIANLSDAFIYIFLQAEVKKYVFRKLRGMLQRRNDYSSPSRNNII